MHINSVQEASLEALNHAAGALYIIYINGHSSLSFFPNIILINNSWRRCVVVCDLGCSFHNLLQSLTGSTVGHFRVFLRHFEQDRINMRGSHIQKKKKKERDKNHQQQRNMHEGTNIRQSKCLCVCVCAINHEWNQSTQPIPVREKRFASRCN